MLDKRKADISLESNYHRNEDNKELNCQGSCCWKMVQKEKTAMRAEQGLYRRRHERGESRTSMKYRETRDPVTPTPLHATTKNHKNRGTRESW